MMRATLKNNQIDMQADQTEEKKEEVVEGCGSKSEGFSTSEGYLVD